MALKTRKPNGTVPPPLVLIEGEEKAGKTTAALFLSRSPRVGTTYVIDLGEGTADEYGAYPGVDYEIVEHDGTYPSVLAAVADVHAEAARAHAAGEPPVVLIVDTMSDVWGGLKDWASARALKSRAGQAALAKDPNAEVKPTMNLWNDAGARHRRIMRYLQTFPGIAVMTARGNEVTEVRDGKPVEGSKTWSVDGHKSLPYDATLWLRLRRGQRPLVVGARSVYVPLRAGQDDPEFVIGDHDDDLLEHLIFGMLRYDPAVATARQVVSLTGGDLTAQEAKAEQTGDENAALTRQEAARVAQTYAEEAMEAPGDHETLAAIRARAHADGVLENVVQTAAGQGPLGGLFAWLANQPRKAPTPPPQAPAERVVCGHEHEDGWRFCDRDPNHDGRHHYPAAEGAKA